MIWLIGGTSEANSLAKKLDGKVPYILTVATKGGLQFTEADNVLVGRLNREEMTEFIRQYKISAIVDCSHPYAKIVTETAKSVAKETKLPYYRYHRPENRHVENGIFVKNVEECREVLKDIKGTVFFTTGSKNIKDYEPVRGENRFIYRILPTSESFLLAEQANVPMKDLIGALGPFDEEFNRLLFRKFHADYCVTKESGAGSGTDEKLSACEKEGVIPVIILREEEDGIADLNELYRGLVKNYGKLI